MRTILVKVKNLISWTTFKEVNGAVTACANTALQQIKGTVITPCDFAALPYGNSSRPLLHCDCDSIHSIITMERWQKSSKIETNGFHPVSVILLNWNGHPTNVYKVVGKPRLDRSVLVKALIDWSGCRFVTNLTATIAKHLLNPKNVQY